MNFFIAHSTWNLKSNGGKAFPFPKPLWTEKLSDKYLTMRILLYISFKHILVKFPALYSWNSSWLYVLHCSIYLHLFRLHFVTTEIRPVSFDLFWVSFILQWLIFLQFIIFQSLIGRNLDILIVSQAISICIFPPNYIKTVNLLQILTRYYPFSTSCISADLTNPCLFKHWLCKQWWLSTLLLLMLYSVRHFILTKSPTKWQSYISKFFFRN